MLQLTGGIFRANIQPKAHFLWVGCISNGLLKWPALPLMKNFAEPQISQIIFKHMAIIIL